MRTIRCTCTQSFEGVASPVLEISLLSNLAKFPFQPMDYSPWGVKKLNQIELAQKYSCKWGLMPNACTPSLVGMASLFFGILVLLFFLPMRCGPCKLFVSFCDNFF